MKFIYIGIPLVCVLIPIITGCSKSPDASDAETFFTEWLTSHGETDIITDAKGVGVAGNPTRLQASLYGCDEYGDGGYNVEMEFKVFLPSNDEIIEYVAGMGDSKKQAIDDAYVNFIMTTFHVIYKGFINPSDPHQSLEQIECDGKVRDIVMGNTIVKAQHDDPNLVQEIFTLEPQIKDAIANLNVSDKTHWFKMVYSQMNNEHAVVAVTMDNQDHEELTNTVTALNWPKANQFYMAKQFIIIKSTE